MEKIILIGGRGTAIVVAEQICDAHTRFGQPIEVLGLALDDLSNGDSINGFPILCPIKEVMNEYGHYNDVKFIYQLYRPDVLEERVNLFQSLNIPADKLATFIHPTVLLARSAKMGYGNVILANTVVNCNAVLGNCNTINSLTLFGHDTRIGNYNYIAGHVSIGSGIKIGDMNFIGLNSTLRNGIEIEDLAIVGMASNVVKSLASKQVVYGNPAERKDKLNTIIR